MATPNILTSIHGRRLGLANDGSLIVDGSRISGARADDLWAGAPSLNDNTSMRFYAVNHDFISADAAGYTAVNDGSSGSNAYADGVGGIYNVVTAAADNDYHAIASVGESWLFAAGKEMWFEARVRVAEATTDDSTWWVGFTDTLTTGGMQADALGPLASYDGALFFKTPETALTLNFETSNAGTQVTTSAFATSVTNTWTRVGFYFDGVSSITPFWSVNGAAALTQGDAHTISLTGLEEMHMVAGIKAGPGGAAETLSIDYLRAIQLR